MSAAIENKKVFLTSFVDDCYKIDSSKDTLLQKIGKIALIAIAATVVGFLLTMAIYYAFNNNSERTVEPAQELLNTPAGNPLDVFSQNFGLVIDEKSDRIKLAASASKILDPAKRSAPWLDDESL